MRIDTLSINDIDFTQSSLNFAGVRRRLDGFIDSELRDSVSRLLRVVTKTLSSTFHAGVDSLARMEARRVCASALNPSLICFCGPLV